MNLAEGVQIVSFAILSVLVIAAALGVVLLSNIVYSAFLLGGVFISISGIYILLNADFVAAAQILIYVGAVNVLILFGIMLVNKQEDFSTLPRRWIRQGATALVCVGIFILLSTMILVTPWSISTTSPGVIENTIIELGKHFFSDFLLPFELASVLLLMAMVGAIILARRDLIPDTLPTQEGVTTALELPERPSELEARQLAMSKEK
ncbi:NADH-ubiquinone/plastoquinone oxidoreductase chain 6 [Rippkaea orientalis PCC 8801]|uniref:NADH-quinone oxidoreductase subunit J n=1 Tax=Rippkaea orientalis (strain PCC 8801 / RF-1) TaxID=41431 RepID=B7K0U7_RIPO1|nr:NADH-quinone oxidoreductase subunit J [Rippkaea orientalis]ACK65088.1 NADH-ubiquinone/plastoquinone oxidoreductase chain 6 [Rippkaea orientalis PCC 8801]